MSKYNREIISHSRCENQMVRQTMVELDDYLRNQIDQFSAMGRVKKICRIRTKTNRNDHLTQSRGDLLDEVFEALYKTYGEEFSTRIAKLSILTMKKPLRFDSNLNSTNINSINFDLDWRK